MIALVDCNNFYVSCERLFNPRLRNKPVVVLSNNDGCVIARSNEAKKMGIKMGAPAFSYREFFDKHEVYVFSSNYTLYGSLSDRVHELLQSFTPKVEVYSIDEAFLYFEPCIKGFNDLAKMIKDTVYSVIGIPVTVGMAATKTLAKVANHYGKSRESSKGYYVLDTADKIEAVLAITSVEDIWGIGGQYAGMLKKMGVESASKLVKLPPEWIRKNMSVVGMRTVNELKGIPSVVFETEAPAKKNICVARGFGKLLTKKEEVQEALSNFTVMVAKKLRKERLCTSMIQVFIQTNVHRSGDNHFFSSLDVELSTATNSSFELVNEAMKAVDAIFKPGFNYHKAGFVALKLVPEQQVQFAMFDNKERSKEHRVMNAMDEVNSYLGKEMVKVARQGYSKEWKLRQMHLSKCYTTRVSEVLKIST